MSILPEYILCEDYNNNEWWALLNRDLIGEWIGGTPILLMYRAGYEDDETTMLLLDNYGDNCVIIKIEGYPERFEAAFVVDFRIEEDALRFIEMAEVDQFIDARLLDCGCSSRGF